MGSATASGLGPSHPVSPDSLYGVSLLGVARSAATPRVCPITDPQSSSHVTGRMNTHLLTRLRGLFLRNVAYLQDTDAHILTEFYHEDHGLEHVGRRLYF